MKIKFKLFLFLLFATSYGFAQEMTVSGVVKSIEDNAPLPAVNIVVKETQKGTSTDFDGNYSLNVNKGDILEFSTLGMKTTTITVNDETEINIAMETDTQALDEVVVIGYGTVRKSDLTGAVSSLRGDDLTKIPSLSAEQALQGKVSGVRVTSNSGEPGSAPYSKNPRRWHLRKS